MCDTTTSPCSSTPPKHSISRRSLLTAALAGTGAAVASSIAPMPAQAAAKPARAAAPKSARPSGLLQPTGDLLTLLGTSGGPQAEYFRTGTSSVLTVGGVNYIVDAGRSSVTQYLMSGLAFASLRAMFITHLHADHLADYYNYFLLEGGQPNAEGDCLTGPLAVYGPGPAGGLPPRPPHVPTISPGDPTPGIKTLTERLNQGYAYSYNLFMRDSGYSDIRLKQNINEISVPNVGAHPVDGQTAPAMAPFPVYEDDRVRVSAILVPHGAVFPAFAYRFDLADGGSVVFSGDTAFSDNVITLASGADILVHEVINLAFIEQHGNIDPQLLHHLETSHTQPADVAKVATQAGVPNLVLTHLVPSNPLLIPDYIWQQQVSSGGYTGTTYVGDDFDRITLPEAGPFNRSRAARRARTQTR